MSGRAIHHNGQHAAPGSRSDQSDRTDRTRRKAPHGLSRFHLSVVPRFSHTLRWYNADEEAGYADSRLDSRFSRYLS
jgi:hypothetical protein